ncbi:PilN domain-containing protein [Burkholderiaceae bacterium DAT-1]|nr:PilN domain-containing protein [Burkholderiaceae bacterium DAT-1]
MKIDINLADPALIPPDPDFTFSVLGRLLVWVMSFWLVLTIPLLYQNETDRQTARAADQALHPLRQSVAKMNLSAKQVPSDHELQNKLALLEADHRRLLALDGALSGFGAGSKGGFSASLKQLAVAKVDGVWLTEIQLESNRAAFRGRALDQNRIPVFVQSLQSLESLRGVELGGIDMKRIKEPLSGESLFEFELSSPVQGGK